MYWLVSDRARDTHSEEIVALKKMRMADERDGKVITTDSK